VRWVCLEDLAVSSGISAANDRLYAARAFRGAPLEPAGQRPIRRPKPNEVCVELPRAFSVRATSSASLDAPERAYVVVDVWAGTRSHESFPLRVHLYGHGVAADAPALLDEYSVVGLERPDERNPATR
jgi:hypothetical protein